MLVETKKYIEQLNDAGVPNPLSDTARIIDLVCGTQGREFALGKVVDLTQEQEKKISELIAKRASRVPLSRLLETVAFADVDIETGKGVYAPTPESESFIDHAVAAMEGHEAPRLLDLGTGSGCLLLSLLYALPQATGIGVDNSPAAIELARENATRNSLQTRAEFRLGDWVEGLREKFDLVISNPPRAATESIAHLLPEMRDHDPFESLDGGNDGVRFFRRLADDFRNVAKPQGIGIFQIGPSQVRAVENIFHERGYKKIGIKLSIFGQPVCVIVANELT
jgi:release factor glutamine methyltransferase